MQPLLTTKGKYTALSLAVMLTLSGCSEGENKADHHNHQDSEHSPSAMSRLVVTEQGSTNLYVLEGKNWAPLEQFNLQNTPSGLKTSPDGRYALALQRNQNLVEVLDSGIEAEAHGDHFHLHVERPQLLTTQYQGIKPTHYDLSDDTTALFFDGDSNSGENAEFRVLNDASIANGTALAHYTFGYAVHGTAQLFGEHAFTGIVDNAANPALPNKVVALERHGDHFHELSTSTDACPALHGSAQSKTQVAFACSDGVIVVDTPNATPQFTKLANPAGLDTGSRFGTVVGFDAADKLLFLTRQAQAFYLAQGELKEVNWKSSPEEGVLAHYAANDALVVVSSNGTLKVFNAAANFIQSHNINLWEMPPALAEGQKIQLTEDKRTGHLIVSDPANNQLLEIDLVKEEVRQHPLDFVPHLLTWVGTVEQEHQH
ncbi:hypothetical protein ACAS46_002865 [Vibrio vulnificus]